MVESPVKVRGILLRCNSMNLDDTEVRCEVCGKIIEDFCDPCAEGDKNSEPDFGVNLE